MTSEVYIGKDDPHSCTTWAKYVDSNLVDKVVIAGLTKSKDILFGEPGTASCFASYHGFVYLIKDMEITMKKHFHTLTKQVINNIPWVSFAQTRTANDHIIDDSFAAVIVET